MADDLVCNFRKCRKKLGAYGWVTSCSHIFCDEDGSREFAKSYSCPACDTSLTGKGDIIRMDLQPSEQYKSMVLAGQRPETALEIATRALSFWTYQMSQERLYQEFLYNKYKERGAQVEQYYEQILTRTKTELSSLQNKLSTAKKDACEWKKKYHSVQDELSDKNRQYQKLQTLYDSLRRKNIMPHLLDGDPQPSTRHPSNFSLPGHDQGLGGMDLAHKLHQRSFDAGDRDGERTERGGGDFIFAPQHTPSHRSDPPADRFSLGDQFKLTIPSPNTGTGARHRGQRGSGSAGRTVSPYSSN